jgi:hypothetical protein
METEYKYGVYMKLNGNLFIISKGMKHKYEVDENRPCNDPAVKAMHKIYGYPNPTLIMFADSLGWGPSSFVNYSEYLGEL